MNHISMVISDGLNACALALDRFRGEVESHTGQIETGLCLGAESEKTVMPYVQKAFQSSLSAFISLLLVRRQIFSDADQLLLQSKYTQSPKKNRVKLG